MHLGGCASMSTARGPKSQRTCCTHTCAQQQTRVEINSASTHSVRQTKPLQGAKPPQNTNGWDTHRSTNATQAVPRTLGKQHPRPCTHNCPCIHRRLRTNTEPRPSLPPPAPQCAQQNHAYPCLRTRTRRRHAWPTNRRSARKRPRPRPHQTTATAAPAPNNPPQRPRPPRGDQNLARKASTHLCLPADRPWPRAGPKRGAGIRPKKRVTKYVPQQLGDTVRDSKLGPPNGPLKNALRQALLPARKRPHARKTNTTSPLSRQGNAQAHHN